MAKELGELRAEALKTMRERRISAREVSRGTGMKTTTVTSFIYDRREARPGTVALVCQYLGLDRDSAPNV